MALGFSFFFPNTREQKKEGCMNIIILHAGSDVNNEAKIFRIEIAFARLKHAI